MQKLIEVYAKARKLIKNDELILSPDMTKSGIETRICLFRMYDDVVVDGEKWTIVRPNVRIDNSKLYYYDKDQNEEWKIDVKISDVLLEAALAWFMYNEETELNFREMIAKTRKSL
jgi:hypothetical protein